MSPPGSPARRRARCTTSAKSNRIGFALGAPDEVFPQTVGGLALKHEVRLRVEHEPEAALHFFPQLVRLPQHHAGEEARLLRLALDDAIDHRAVERDVKARRQLQRAPA